MRIASGTCQCVCRPEPTAQDAMLVIGGSALTLTGAVLVAFMVFWGLDAIHEMLARWKRGGQGKQRT